MKVKAIRTGYHKGLKQPGDKFDFEGSKCPSWCEKEKTAVKRIMRENKEEV